jgi:hypothetical protein
VKDGLKKPVEQFFTHPDKVEENQAYDEKKPDEKKKIDYLKNNSLAYSILMLNQSDIVTLNAISSDKTIDLPNGYAWQAWENIQALHAPSNHGTKNDLIQRFNHSTLHHAGQRPDEWFSDLDMIRSELLIQYNHGITESDTFNHIIYILRPKIYEITLAMIKREINDPKYVPHFF